MKHFQAELQRKDPPGDAVTVRVCWLPAGIRVGDRVTLKNSEDPDVAWDVTWVGCEGRELAEINRGWNNNI